MTTRCRQPTYRELFCVGDVVEVAQAPRDGETKLQWLRGRVIRISTQLHVQHGGPGHMAYPRAMYSRGHIRKVVSQETVEPCKACKTRQDKGLRGQCYACANERARLAALHSGLRSPLPDDGVPTFDRRGQPDLIRVQQKLEAHWRGLLEIRKQISEVSPFLADRLSRLCSELDDIGETLAANEGGT